jgi:cell division protein FtsB
VRNTVLAIAVAATLALAAPQALAEAKGSATKAELQAIQAQMQALAERLNKLEASNTELQAENDQLKAVVERRDSEIDYLKAQTKDLREEGAVAANEIDKVKGADWATKLKGRGDFRYRHEMISPERVVDGEAVSAADRTRQRIRARLGFDYKITDTVKGVQPDARRHRHPQVGRRGHGLRRLEVHERRRPRSRQAALRPLATGPEPVLRR